MGCSGYDAIAHVYEKLNSEIDYKKWADFIEACFDKYLSIRPSLVLDLACGTGTMTRELSRRGYDMIGIDGSADMLTEAFMQKEEGESTLYLRGCTVVLNTEELEIKVTMRMLDFLNGVTYTTGGEIKNVNNTTFIITPNYVDVSDT